MHASQFPNGPRRRVGIYERFGRSAGASPARTVGIGIAILAILIVLIVVFFR
jgi:hypothetical protein